MIYRCAGRPRWHKIADVSIGIDAARKIAQRVAFEVASGRDPQGERVSDRAAGSFAELHRLYVDGHAKRFNKSWRQAAKLIDNHVLPHLGRAKAAAVSRTDVKTVMARLADRPPLANAVLASISAVFSWAVAEEVGGVSANPCARIRRNETRSARARVVGRRSQLLSPEFDPDPSLTLADRSAHERGHKYACRRHSRWRLEFAGRGNRYWPGREERSQSPRPVVRDGRRSRRSAPRRPIAPPIQESPCASRGETRAAAAHAARSSSKLRHARRAPRPRSPGDGPTLEPRRSHVASVYDRHGYEAEDRRIVDAIARHVVAVVDGTATDNVVRLRSS